MKREIGIFIDDIFEKYKNDPSSWDRGVEEIYEKYPKKIYGRIIKAVLDKKMRKMIKKIGKSRQKLGLEVEKNLNTIENENFVLTFFNLIKTEFLKYLKLEDLEQFSNNKTAKEKVKDAISVAEKAEKNQFTSWYGMKEWYKKLSAYFMGIEKRIGHINDNKYNKTLVNEARKKIMAKHKEISRSEDTTPLDTKFLGDKDCHLYVSCGCGILILEELLEKEMSFNKEDMKYLKGCLTRIKRWYNDLEKYIGDMAADMQSQNDRLQQEKKDNALKKELGPFYRLVLASCKMERVNFSESTRDVWGGYFEQLKGMKKREITEERKWLGVA
jgi:hypothetical protein